MDKIENTEVKEIQEGAIQYVHEEQDIELQMEGGSALEMEGGTKKQAAEAKEQFILFRAFWFCYQKTMNFLSALWKCEDGKCKPTIYGWIVIVLLITLFIYLTFFTGKKQWEPWYSKNTVSARKRHERSDT